MPQVNKITSNGTPQPQAAGEIRTIVANTKAHSSPTVPTTQPKQTLAPPPVESPVAAALAATPVGQTDGTEGQTSEAKEALSPQYAALARKESALRTKEKEFQAKELEFKAKEAQLSEAQSFKDRLKSNPLDVLNEIGITYDDLVQAAVNQPNPEISAVQKKIKELEDKQAKQVEEMTTREKAQRESAINQLKFDAGALIESDPAFETIKATDSVDEVVDKIVKTFDETGKLMTVEEAAKQVEEELFAEAIKIAGISKVKNKLTPQAVEETKTKEATGQQPITTLTNTLNSGRQLTARERAILRFKGETF